MMTTATMCSGMPGMLAMGISASFGTATTRDREQRQWKAVGEVRRQRRHPTMETDASSEEGHDDHIVDVANSRVIVAICISSSTSDNKFDDFN